MSGGKAQADFFLDNAQYVSDGRTLPPMLDIEWPRSTWPGLNACYNLTPTQLSAWIRDFVDEVARRTGRLAIIYTQSQLVESLHQPERHLRGQPAVQLRLYAKPTAATGRMVHLDLLAVLRFGNASR